MLHRPISLGCQPNGFITFDDEKGKHGIVAYDRKLTDKELSDFEMQVWNTDKENEIKNAKELNKTKHQEKEMEI